MMEKDFESMHYSFLYFNKLFSTKTFIKQMIIEIMTRNDGDKSNITVTVLILSF